MTIILSEMGCQSDCLPFTAWDRLTREESSYPGQSVVPVLPHSKAQPAAGARVTATAVTQQDASFPCRAPCDVFTVGVTF